MDSKNIRQQFIDFFKAKDHSIVRSASLVPRDDPTLLFTNAGMNQFKNIFLGKEIAKSSRVVNSQKCIRVSGKHNDLDEVGYDAFHHTFFEMLGNWSFGDYYKAEAIQWAWELVTEVWGMSKDRLWATVYEEDIEAETLWKEVTDIDPSRVLKFGKKDNFWEMGETGPCGPCSEIHYFIGDDLSKQNREGVNASPQAPADNKFWELWNLVFIQNNRNPDGSIDELPQKHVDTGAGLERIVAVLQNKTSNYDTDLFQPIIRTLEEVTKTRYRDHKIAHRVISDHVRMLVFAISDGVLPSNEGRGYVARRILRRAARFGGELGYHEPFIHRLVKTVVDEMGDIYPELVEKQRHVEKIIEAEEISFNETLDRGMGQFHKIVADLSGTVIPGLAAFRLYDTFGFPIDLTEQMAREQNLTVDVVGFKVEMDEQRQRTRAMAKFKFDTADSEWIHLTKGEDSKFLGYTKVSAEGTIRRYQQKNGSVLIVLDQTPFYAEQGGQIGDTGFITGDGFKIRITNTVKEGTSHIHVGEFISGEKIITKNITAEVESVRRQNIRKNHTATHLLHEALKMILGEHVHQAGSLVTPDYLRFDLTHYQKITGEEIQKIEKIVNEEILKNTLVDIAVKDFDTAREEGAVAIFEEKYGDEVRVISIGNFSKELCGGIHVERTGDIGFFKITEESSLATGVRRLVAVTGPGAVDYVIKGLTTLSEIQDLLNCSYDEVTQRVGKLTERKRELEKELKKRRTSDDGLEFAKLMSDSIQVGESKVVACVVEADDMDHLKTIGDRVLKLMKSGIGVLGSEINSKVSIVCVVSKDLITKGIKAGDIAKEIGNNLGGGGGGKSHLATAGGKDPSNMKIAIDSFKQDLVNKLKNVNE
ncbi:MAG: alanine--tRNA ligase [Candidatus Marinimicrobia bacterium]|nr:alanine--tRNA ligase [Candidatus Neomarinimicrobiota bacterium]